MKSVWVLAVVLAFVAGTLTTGMVASAVPPSNNPGQTFAQIIALLTDPIFGLEEIKTEVTNLEDTQYIPFKIRGPSSTVSCDAAGGAFTSDIDMRIQSLTGKDFVVTSIIWRPTGIDQAGDFIGVDSLHVDGLLTGFFSGDLTGSVDVPGTIDFTQIPTSRGVGNFPDQIVVSGSIGSGISKDIRIILSCAAGASGDINMNTNLVQVSGWKLKGDTITLTAVST